VAKFFRFLIIIGCGGTLGLFVAWLETRYGVSPLWFSCVATGLGLLFTILIALSLLKTRRSIFVLDWVVRFESLILVSVLSVFGIVALPSVRVSSPAIILLIASALLGGVVCLIVYVFKRAPQTTWDDAEQIVGPEPPPASFSSK